MCYFFVEERLCLQQCKCSLRAQFCRQYWIHGVAWGEHFLPENWDASPPPRKFVILYLQRSKSAISTLLEPYEAPYWRKVPELNTICRIFWLLQKSQCVYTNINLQLKKCNVFKLQVNVAHLSLFLFAFSWSLLHNCHMSS